MNATGVGLSSPFSFVEVAVTGSAVPRPNGKPHEKDLRRRGLVTALVACELTILEECRNDSMLEQ